MTATKTPRIATHVLIALLATVAPTLGADKPETLADLKRDHEREAEAIQKRWEEAGTDAQKRETAQAEARQEIKATARRVCEWAEAHPDDPEAIDAIVWTVHGLANGFYPEYVAERSRAFGLLTERALASEKVVPLAYYASGASFLCPEEVQFLRASLERSPSRLVRGAACLGLARADHGQALLARRVKDSIMRKSLDQRWKGTTMVEELELCDPELLDARAETSFHRVIEEFGDLKMPEPYNQATFAELAGGELYELRHLGVGKVAPEIEGEEVGGRKVRLADYRGKVVAVVFWASWCGPCMEMVPHEREMVKRLKDKPFVLLGINGDDDRAKASELIAKEAMAWPSIWDGGKTGGLVERLGVRGWPTIYVLDARGVIRYKNVRGESLDEAVDRLLAEVEAAGK